MESMVLGPLLQVIFDRLASPIIEKFQTCIGFNEEIEKLLNQLPMIQAVIEDAEERQPKDKRVKLWLAKLRDIIYDADELMDELSSHVRPSNGDEVSMFSSLDVFGNYINLPPKLKKIRERFDNIAREMSAFHFREVVFKRSETDERRETGPEVDETQIYGRKTDADKIAEILLSTNNPNDSVIAIVGIGGIGKTTLAQLVYNDEKVTRHFDLKIWVSVNNNFNVRKLMSDILDYAVELNYGSSQMGLLQSQLRETLCGKRYLLVLDDVWNEDQDQWDGLRLPLRAGAVGSKIIVTTRSKKVASIMSTDSPYMLEALTEDDCWTLFKQRAFSDREEERYPNLLPLGKKIVSKCKGIPLAAKILGSLMRFKREESQWLYVEESELWNLDEGNSKLLSVLKLSYNHLPSHLKPCFAYCSVLPKNYEINKGKLVHLWIAEGLISLSNDHRYGRKMEDAGNEYFNDLLWMSFFQVVSKCEDNNTAEFKMHDLIHDLSQSVAGKEILILTSNPAGNLAQIRHASVVCNFGSSLIPKALYTAKKLRTLNLMSPQHDSGEALSTVFTSFRHLRVLDLSGCGIQTMHSSIRDLVYLRYLDISNTPIEILPETICNLRNLQTLNLSGCNALLTLPGRLTKLINLRHLNIKDCGSLTRMPASIGYLEKLQTLPIFIVGCTEEESLYNIDKLLDLRGELKIKHMENVGENIPFECFSKKQLHSLALSWGNVNKGKFSHHASTQTEEGNWGAQAQDVLSVNRPNRDLKRLSLNQFPGTMFPDWIHCAELPNLTRLELINCSRCENLPKLGQLRFLKVLSMQGMNAVENIQSAIYDEKCSGRPFPSLRELTIKDFPNLRNWEAPNSTQAFTSLEKLTISKCPSLTSMPSFPSLRHLELQNCNALLLRSTADLRSLSTLVIDVNPELVVLPEELLQNNSSLVTLSVSSCSKLVSLPTSLGKLTALKSLVIRWCEELDTFPQELKNLTSLESLEITECPGLISFPEESIEGLTSLRSFSLENCHNLTHLPRGMKHLTALEHLTIMYCSNLANLPEGLEELSSLRSLNILSCQELASLPHGLQQVKTLQILEIRSCLKLRELPEWVENLVLLRSLSISDCQNLKSLPEGLQRLSALQHLSIRDCPYLERRCRKLKGEDWDKISHIPYIYIGSSALHQRDEASSSS